MSPPASSPSGRRRLARLAFAGLAGAFLLIGGWPLDPFPRNRAEWLRDGPGLRFQPSSVALVRPTPPGSAVASPSGFTVEVLLRARPQPKPVLQHILTWHDGSLPSGLAVCQWKSDLLLWIPDADSPRGIREIGTTVADGDVHLVTLVFEGPEARIHVDGALRRRSGQFGVPPSVLQGLLVLGDAPEGKRCWNGELLGLMVHGAAFDTARVAERSLLWRERRGDALIPQPETRAAFGLTEGRGRRADGRIPGVWAELPEHYSVVRKIAFGRDRNLAVLLSRDRLDVILNLAGFVPLGVLAWAARAGKTGGARFLGGLGLVVAVSLTIETGQIWLPERVSSLVDLVCNVAGGVVGLAVAGFASRIADRVAAPARA